MPLAVDLAGRLPDQRSVGKDPKIVTLGMRGQYRGAPLVVILIGQRLKPGRRAWIDHESMDESDKIRGQRHLMPARHGRTDFQNGRALDGIYRNDSA
jgi:hypothetical protein